MDGAILLETISYPSQVVIDSTLFILVDLIQDPQKSKIKCRWNENHFMTTVESQIIAAATINFKCF